MRDDVILEAAIYRVERRSQVFDVKPSFNYGALSAMVGQKYIFVAGNFREKMHPNGPSLFLRHLKVKPSLSERKW